MANFDELASLDTSRTTWKIKVRVTRMWPSVSSASDSKNVLKGYNLILVDENNSHIHAFVYADNWKSHKEDIEEGGLYIITNFYTREATGNMRPTSSKFLINFSNSTTIQKVLEEDFMIPAHKFEFVDLSELFNVASKYENSDNPEFSTDVIGVLEDFERVRPIQTMFGERNIVKFRITDGRYSHKVSVWGQLAHSTDESYEQIRQSAKDVPIIVIVTSTKLKIFKNSVQISTLPSSKIYLNLENDFVSSMRLRLEEEGYHAPENSMSEPLPTPPPPVIETITLKELSEKTRMSDKEKLFLCNVNITQLEENENWWYFSCPNCDEEVTMPDGKWNCGNCNQNIPVAEKKYKIVVLAGDSTEGFNFVLADKAAKRLIGQTATKLIFDGIKSKQIAGYPPAIKEIVGKECSFTIEISNDNVLIKSKIFKVKDAHDSNKRISSPSQTTTGGCSTSSNADSYSANNMVDLSNFGHTPESVKSSAKKIKMEK